MKHFIRQFNFAIALFLMSFASQGRAQSTPQQVLGSGWQALTNASPAVTSDGTNRYIAWRGLNNDVYFAIYNGKSWTSHQIVGGPGWTAETSAAPALQYAGYGTNVWLAWKGKSSNKVYFSTWDGTQWTPQQVVQGSDPSWTALTNVAPAIGVSAFTPYLAWKGATGDKIWYTYQTFEGPWATQQVVQGSDPSWTAETSASPSLTNDDSGDQLLYWKGKSGDSIWNSFGAIYLPSQVANWNGQATIGCDASTEAGPSAAEFSNPSEGYTWTIVTFWKSSSSDQIIYDFPCGSAVSHAATNVAPAVATYSGEGTSSASILAWKNATDNTIWFLDPTTLPGMTVF
jgi:hypothetical protein